MKTLNQVEPEMGMSVSYHIGSDSYHQIIARITRNGRTIETLNAEIVLNGLTNDEWNALPKEVRLEQVAICLAKQLKFLSEQYERTTLFNIYTLRNNGYYQSKGIGCGWLELNSTYEYFDPSF